MPHLAQATRVRFASLSSFVALSTSLHANRMQTDKDHVNRQKRPLRGFSLRILTARETFPVTPSTPESFVVCADQDRYSAGSVLSAGAISG